MEGAIYFEITIQRGCEGFKVGVTRSLNFDMNKSFSDFDTGYAFFSQGQLRHGSDSYGETLFPNLIHLGVRFGEPCKPKEAHKIGVFLNLLRGEIGFSINGQFISIAFRGEELKQGPFYPAVALREGGAATFGKVVKNPDEIIEKHK